MNRTPFVSGMSDADGHRVMFLAEVALGNPHSIYNYDSSIKAPPAGYDSVIGEGVSEAASDTFVEVRFPDSTARAFTSTPIQRKHQSNFHYSEYLIYRESQCRLRFVIEYTHS
ncbi:unnamed protein product [Dicrocoelium dendriticum]|nr:unnamed protein product [Dicrocoelium dendriticum]